MKQTYSRFSLLLFFITCFFTHLSCKTNFVGTSKILSFKNIISKRGKLRAAFVSNVLNNCKENVRLFDSSKNEIIVRPGMLHLKTKLAIPFVSIKNYLKQIIEDVSYVPKNALRIETSAGVYGVWEDERGIQACLIEKDLLDEQYVQKIVGKDKLLTALTLTLCIEEKGLVGFVNQDNLKTSS